VVPAMPPKSPLELDEARIAVRAMLLAGTPPEKIRALLESDGFSPAQIDELLAEFSDQLPSRQINFRLLLYAGSGVLGFTFFFYTLFFAYRGVSIAFFAPLALGVWGLLNFFNAMPRTQLPPDDRRSVIKKQNRVAFWRAFFPDENP